MFVVYWIEKLTVVFHLLIYNGSPVYIVYIYIYYIYRGMYANIKFIYLTPSNLAARRVENYHWRWKDHVTFPR